VFGVNHCAGLEAAGIRVASFMRWIDHEQRGCDLIISAIHYVSLARTQLRL
jgi:hypothetical protein